MRRGFCRALPPPRLTGCTDPLGGGAGRWRKLVRMGERTSKDPWVIAND